MLNKLVFVWDFLYHEPMSDGTYHWYAIKSFEALVKAATGLGIVELRTLKNKNGEVFSRKKFYELSGYVNIEKSYFSYDITKIRQESYDYLKTFITPDTFVFGFELGLELRTILDDMNIVFINFWYHSWKLFDDAFLMLNTNNQNLFNKLNKYKVQKEKFYFYANYWKIFTTQKGELDYIDFIEDDSCLFIGQTLRDKSTDKDGVMLNILHFKNEMEELSKTYSKIYYIPHPYVQYSEEIEQYLIKTPYIQKLDNISTYHLLMSDKIKKVVGISSSVLYESQFFEKDIQYLFKPLFKIDEDFSIETFVSIFGDYYNPYFWADVLSDLMNTNKEVENKNWFFIIDNKFRNINHLYYGYQNFNEDSRLYEKLTKETLVKFDKQKQIISKIEDRNFKAHNEICNIIENLKNLKLLHLKYFKYKILSNLTLGNAKSRYIEKKENYKEKINSLKRIKNMNLGI